MSYALKKNYYSLYAAIFNPKLTVNEALSYLGIVLCDRANQGRPKKEKKELPIHDILKEYNKGTTINELRLKYHVQSNDISTAIKEAGGRIRRTGESAKK